MDETTTAFVKLADAARRAVSLLNSLIDVWQNVPSDVCELRDDIDRLSSLLESVRHIVTTTGQRVFLTSHSYAVKAFSRDVASALSCLETIGLLVSSLPRENDLGLGSCKPTTLPPLWKSAWLRRRQEIAQVKANIRESSQNILSGLLTLNV